MKFVRMPGNIGVVSNGAGLGMATVDELILSGGSVSAFVDIGGLINHTQIQYALQLLDEDAKTKVIVFNCYGGLTDMALVSSTIKLCLQFEMLNKPTIVRLKGEGQKQAYEMLREHIETINCKFLTIESDFEVLVEKAVAKAVSQEFM